MAAFLRLLVFLLLSSTAALAAPVRVKDLVEFEGVRGNDLVGYGLVVGLNGTGDGLRNTPFTEEIMSNLLERLGVNITGEQMRPRNVAAVMVTGTLPPFSRAGARIDATVSAIGDAKSLLGGTLIMTPLNGADGQIYAVAQGAVLAGGASAEGRAARVVHGVPTAGVIPAGARVEREIDFEFGTLRSMRLAMRNPDFTSASRIERAVNAEFSRKVATMLDGGTIAIDVVATRLQSAAHVISRIENITIEPEGRARVVVDQRSGTIVMGADVRISRVAVAQGGLTLRVDETPVAIQPNPFSRGDTVVVPRTTAELDDQDGTGLAEIPAATNLSQIVAGMNALGVSPRDMIDILKTINAAGALHAEFVVQ